MKVEAIRTPIETPRLLRALVIAFWKLFDVGPTQATIALAGGMWAQETRRGDACYNWNLGNSKATDRWEGDSCERYCTERLTPEQAKGAMSRARPRPDGQGLDAAIIRPDGDLLIVGFWPSNPASRFRAFDTIEAGAVDYLDLLHNRFGGAWADLLVGDPQRFAYALREQGYYTADKDKYATGLASLQREFSKIPIDLSPPAVDVTAALAAVQAESLRQLSWDTMREDLDD